MTDGAAPPILRITDVAKTYGSGPEAKQAIAEVSFDVHHGELVCVVGPSGAGKTTLLRCIAGLLPPTSGVVELDGQQVVGPPRRLALVFQDYSRSLLPWLTVLHNVTLPLRAKGMSKPEARQLAMDTLAAVSLPDAATRYPWQLSGGMQQRVAIARALAYQPEVLLMDEPFASVDAQTRMELEDLVHRLRGQFDITTVFVTHDIDEAVYLANRVVVLSQSPTRVRDIITVTLPDERDQMTTKTDLRFGELRTKILGLISNANLERT